MLRFKEADDFFNGNPYIQMTYRDFDLPAIDTYPNLAFYNVFTFAIFRKQRDIAMCYAHVNLFLKSLSLDIQKTIAESFTLCNAFIQDDTHIDVDETVDYCKDVLDTMEKETNICDLIENYTRENVYTPDMSDAGTHPQDREDLTFGREEAIIMSALFITMKLFNPIIGQFIYKYGPVLGNKFKERMVASIFTPIFKRKYRKLIEKINHYAERLVSNKIKKGDANMHYKGYTVANIASLASDILLVKKSASIDLTKQDGYIIKFVASCIKSLTESLQKSSVSSLLVKTFDNPKENDSSSIVEESNSSRIETESRPSKKPADTMALAVNSVKRIIPEIINKYGLDRDLINSVFMWYRDNPVILTPMSVYIVTCYYGLEINGKNIDMVNPTWVIKLAAILQILAMKGNCVNLAHALTLSSSIEDRTSTALDFKFMNAWKSSAEYMACKKIIPNSFGLVQWDSQLKKIANHLTKKNFIYHTAPLIYEINNLENTNGQIFNNNLGLMTELLAFVRAQWIRGSSGYVLEDTDLTLF